MGVRNVVKRKGVPYKGKMLPASEVMDRTAEKFEQLGQWKREFGHGGPHEQVDGFARRNYRCLDCGTVNSCPVVTQAYTTTAPCGTCGVVREQERV